MVFGPRRVGRPGLLGTAARTAAVVGTATATRNAVNRRAQRKYSQQDEQEYYDQQQAYAQPQQQYAPPPPAPAPPAEDEMITKLKQLGELHNQGVLSDEEFASAKAKLLG
ncbi:SHOCT domain-containing protein [Aldersonia kunmingensis]|uniref:SHOCT domain-containing protein n=1 Tax=Aldersonia kunmingensis TaxID=408066 RepID=UPI0008324B07|nr:SHOCT domain-containing protein [Aldersonia kunmingensis]